MKKIPIVFAFDDNYALPAGVAISSLLESRDAHTFYDIFIFNSGLSDAAKAKIEALKNTYDGFALHWVHIPDDYFKDAPTGWSGIATYYRLIIQDFIPDYDKVIWSDVDVLFKRDMAEIYSTDIEDVYWSGIIAERSSAPKQIHEHFPENKNEYIYMPGFMLVNLRKMRKDNMTAKFLQVLKDFGPRIKMYDLDVLNLGCDKIGAVPFEYCVLEGLYYDGKKSPEYKWLSLVYNDYELFSAVKKPSIIHYAGRVVKVWNRIFPDPQYVYFINKSGFGGEFLRRRLIRVFKGVLRPFVKVLLWFTYPRSLRKKIRTWIK